jgi:uncharacterized protein
VVARAVADAAVVAVAVAANVVTLGDRQTPSSTLGVGLGFRDPYHADVFLHRPSIDFLEVVADHFFRMTPAKERQLELLRNNFPLIPHGLGLSLGSADGLDQSYLEAIADVVRRIKPVWWSEHIAFTRSQGIDIGHLTPLPRTKETLRVLHENIQRVQDVIDTPLILENITESISFGEQEYDEAAFLGELLDQNKVGLLLDVTNLYTNSVNYRFDPLKILDRLPADRIVQLHFTGGHWEDGLLVDSHSSATPSEVWQLLEEVLKYAPVRGLILERDEKLPPIEELVVELDHARAIWNQVRIACSA